jgi:hypothetical protein
MVAEPLRKPNTTINYPGVKAQVIPFKPKKGKNSVIENSHDFKKRIDYLSHKLNQEDYSDVMDFFQECLNSMDTKDRELEKEISFRELNLKLLRDEWNSYLKRNIYSLPEILEDLKKMSLKTKVRNNLDEKLRYIILVYEEGLKIFYNKVKELNIKFKNDNIIKEKIDPLLKKIHEDVLNDKKSEMYKKFNLLKKKINKLFQLKHRILTRKHWKKIRKRRYNNKSKDIIKEIEEMKHYVEKMYIFFKETKKDYINNLNELHKLIKNYKENSIIYFQKAA